MKKKKEEKTNQIKSIIHQTLKKLGYKSELIMLFGSRAENRENEESDYDILVILKKSLNLKTRRRIAVNLALELHKAFTYQSFDIIVKSAKQYEDEKEIVNTISHQANLKGIKL